MATVGVLAMQGGYERHRATLARCGAHSIEVRSRKDLERAERLILPGGESSTIYRLLLQSGLWEPLRERIQNGMPVFGTCAGMILLAQSVAGQAEALIQNYGRQPSLGAIDIEVQRNAYGRQIASFSSKLKLSEQNPQNPEFARFLQKQTAKPNAPKNNGAHSPDLPLIFIRAPQVLRWGAGVQVLLWANQKVPKAQTANEAQSAQAVCLQQGKVLVSSFHPELSESTLLHEYFLRL